MRVAPEGWPFILIAWALTIGLGIAGVWWASALLLPVAVWVVAFFRDPVRDGPRGDDLVIAPADGMVVSVIPIDEPMFLHGPSTRVSIFMNVFSVHVNRYPARGRVGLRRYVPGKFGHAGPEKASLENEQSSIGLEAPRGKLLIRQIAGSIARRIVTDHPEGTEVAQGERLGLIRFGSRVDLFVPPNCAVQVAVGQKTTAGLTVVARWS